jgi:hypothetical protein
MGENIITDLREGGYEDVSYTDLAVFVTTVMNPPVT